MGGHNTESDNKTPRVTLSRLLSLRFHADHKLYGFAYIFCFIATVFQILYNKERYEQDFILHLTVPILGLMVNISALRNFKFLPRRSENPGMFVEGHTFSYAFLQENLWFQAGLALIYITGHPSFRWIPVWINILVGYSVLYFREYVPKTSYVSWDVGNKAYNPKKNRWVEFIALQVKLVRWNYVLKKTLVYYIWSAIQLELLLHLPRDALIPIADRQIYYLLALDAMHNITTAFFFQTLKFKGFISAETFSFLFNASPMIGAILTIYLLMIHRPIYSLAIAAVLELAVNLAFVYPSKRMSPHWKNRFNVTFRGLLFAVSVYVCTYYPHLIGAVSV